jgi:hypothetical protein
MGALVPLPPLVVVDATTTDALGVAPLLPPERATLPGRPSATHGPAPLPLMAAQSLSMGGHSAGRWSSPQLHALLDTPHNNISVHYVGPPYTPPLPPAYAPSFVVVVVVHFAHGAVILDPINQGVVPIVPH